MSLNLQGKIATVFGGTGFVGRYVVENLAKAGATVRVVTRHQQSAYFLRTAGAVGQIVPVSISYRKAEEIDQVIAGSTFVVNCIGSLNETRKNQFSRIHTEVPGWIAQSCARHNVGRFVHLSALSADRSSSRYSVTKHLGEKSVFAAYQTATILRPGAIFGPEDNFFNMFARMATVAPALPLIGGGRTKFQLIYVGDVAAAVMAALTLPALGSQNPQGKVYELGGPEILSFKEIQQRILTQTRRKKPLVNLPWGIARVQAALCSVLPKPPLTNDQITGLKTDNVVHAGAYTLSDLGIQPVALDAILPSYLDRYRPGGRFAEKKRA